MVDLVDHRSIMTIPIGRENIRENHPRGRIHENLCCNVLHLPGSSRSVPHSRIIRFFCHGQLTSTEPGDHFECTIWRFRSSQSRQNATSSKRKTIQQWCDSARVPLWRCTCWCPIKKSWSQLSSSSNNLSHRQDHYKHRGCWQNLVPKASAGKTHLISQRFLASQLGIVGQSIGRPVGILRIKSMIQVILTALAPRLSGFTVSPCSGISALREAWLLVGTVERNKQKKLDPSSLMWPLKQPILDIQCGWLALSHVKSLTTCCHLLPSIDWLLLIESCPAPPARAGGRAISWQVEKKTWDEPMMNRSKMAKSWHLLMIFAMRIYDTFLYIISKDILYDLQVSWSLSQANYQIASSPGSKDSLKQTHGDLDSRTLMTCSHAESFSIRP